MLGAFGGGEHEDLAAGLDTVEQDEKTALDQGAKWYTETRLAPFSLTIISLREKPSRP